MGMAVMKALQSQCKYKISAIGLNKKGEVIDTAFNYVRYYKNQGGIHAEQILIARNGRSIKTIIICRVNNKGNILPIDPCNKCEKIAKKMGIKIISICS